MANTELRKVSQTRLGPALLCKLGLHSFCVGEKAYGNQFGKPALLPLPGKRPDGATAGHDYRF